MSRRRAASHIDRFELGGYYLDRPWPGRGGFWYACRYEPRTRRVSRRSLETTDLEEAKIELATFVTTAPPVNAAAVPGPDRVLTVAALKMYCAGHATTIRSESDAARARDLAEQYLDHVRQPAAPLSFWTPSRQLDFGRWLHDSFGHSASSIERRLDVLHSALADMAKVKLRLDPFGNQVEIALVTHVPKFVYKRARLAKELKIAPPRPRHNQTSIAEMGALLDALDAEHLFRFAIIALNTWARPEAVADFDPRTQVDYRAGLIDLNPPGRPQTNKRRPQIPLTRCLAGWLERWATDDAMTAARRGDVPRPVPLLMFQGEPVKDVKKALGRQAKTAGVPFTPGAFRHFMATTVRRLARGVTREQRSLWLGHAVREGSRTTDNYEAFDPEYLADVALATDYVLLQVQWHCQRLLFAVELQLNRKDLARIGVKAEQKTKKLQLVAGGR